MIHRYWTPGPQGEKPPMEPWLGRVLRKAHEVIEWTDAKLDFVEWTSTCVGDARQQARHRANVARYQILSKYGGIWLDHDAVPLRSLPAGPWVASVGASPMTCAMAFDAGHPMLEEMIQAQRQLSKHTTSLESGDRLFAKIMQDRNYPVQQLQIMYDRQGRLLDERASLLHLWHGATANPTRR